jgi:hypothetical protein
MQPVSDWGVAAAYQGRKRKIVLAPVRILKSNGEGIGLSRQDLVMVSSVDVKRPSLG